MTTSLTSPSLEGLHSFWKRTLDMANGTGPAMWLETDYHLSLMGMGMEETLNYLYAERPTFDGFLQWARASHIPGTQTADPTEPVPTDDDLANWNRDGYIRVKN